VGVDRCSGARGRYDRDDLTHLHAPWRAPQHVPDLEVLHHVAGNAATTADDARDAQNALTGLGTEQWSELTQSVAQLPDDLLVHSHRHDPASRVDPGKRPFALDLRES